ncbi:MAG: hypothetical protein PHN45_01875 [Methylococcales bacterium]|nr:hypothetical protein [Methylococcales bacterium]
MCHAYVRIFVYVFAGVFGLAFLLVLFVFVSGLSSETNQPLQKILTPEHIAQAKQILHEGTKIKPDELATITLTEADLNLAGNYLLNRYRQSAIHVELVNQKLRCTFALKLPSNFVANYFNVSFRLGSEAGETLPRITKFKIGKLLLPAKLANWMMHALIRYSFLNDYFILATTPIQRVEIAADTLTIFYESNSLSRTVNAESRAVYQQKLTEVIAQHDPKWRLSLAELLKPVFELAYQRATLETAIQENHSAILAINDYVNSVNNPQYAAFLYKRTDLAKHFMGAAALTASTNSRVGNALGEVKELSDSKAGGSGFSFVDLAADKAGSRFGELAVLSPESARRIQKLTSKIKDYTDFMPDPSDLPEHMDETEFKRLFESTQSPAYLALAAKIDQRIAQLPLYQITTMNLAIMTALLTFTFMGEILI